MSGVDKAAAAKIGGVDAPTGVAAPTIAVVSGDDNRVMSSTTEGFASGTWSMHSSNDRDVDRQRNIAYGKLPDGADTWSFNRDANRIIRLD